MRQNFRQQQALGITPISEVIIPKSRHELTPVLAALQHIFITQELNERIFSLIGEKVKGNKQDTGRPGMDLWEILVFAVVRLAANANYDQLHHYSNFDKLVRQIAGVENKFNDGKTYSLQTLKDNVGLLDEETIQKVNEIVVEAAHQFVLKKKEQLRIKSDTYVFETNVHFPTDLNLLWDASRKCLDIMKYFITHNKIEGWRKVNDWRSKIKSSLRSTGKACASTSKNKDILVKKEVEEYLRLVRELNQKVTKTAISLTRSLVGDLKLLEKLVELSCFQEMVIKHIDLVERRLIKGQTIPSNEKIYSIFESHTEWISKGKMHKKVELGHRVLIATDQYHFILHYQVIENKTDVELTIPLVDKLVNSYKNIESLSLDKGFYSKTNKEYASEFIPVLILPKKGKTNIQERAEESEKKFKKLRNHHSAIESNINQLEHNGLDRCPDKGLKNYKRYVGLGILAYNLHRLGKIIQTQQAEIAQKQAA